VAELRAIFETWKNRISRRRSVIVIDDARNLGWIEGYPSALDLQAMVCAWDPGPWYDMKLIYDQLAILPRSNL
jgi:hypothetical protein